MGAAGDGNGNGIEGLRVRGHGVVQERGSGGEAVKGARGTLGGSLGLDPPRRPPPLTPTLHTCDLITPFST